MYPETVEKAVQEVLEEIKSHTPDQWVDLWAHFGQVLIHGVDEGNIRRPLDLLCDVIFSTVSEAI